MVGGEGLDGCAADESQVWVFIYKRTSFTFVLMELSKVVAFAGFGTSDEQLAPCKNDKKDRLWASNR